LVLPHNIILRMTTSQSHQTARRARVPPSPGGALLKGIALLRVPRDAIEYGETSTLLFPETATPWLLQNNQISKIHGHTFHN